VVPPGSAYANLPSPKVTLMRTTIPSFVPRTQRTVCALVLFLLLSACADSDLATGPSAPEAPLRSLSSGVLESTPGFYFLTPLVKEASYEGTFDPERSPVVEICDAPACEELHASFSMTEGTGSELLRVDEEEEHYVVNWRTSLTGATAGETLRIRVREADDVLGHADVVMVGTGGEAAAIERDGSIALIVGQALPIRFRIETGSESDSEVVTQLVGPSGGELTLPGATLVIASGALDDEVEITMARVSDPTASDVMVVGGTAVQFSPSGLTFNSPASLVLSFDPALVPDEQDIADLGMLRLEEDGTSTTVPGSVDPVGMTVTGMLSSFSLYFVGSPIMESSTRWVGGAMPDPRDWHDPDNWSGNLPDASHSAFIPADSDLFPQIGSIAHVRDLTVQPGASIEIGTESLVIWGSLIADGSITSAGGLVFMSETDGDQRIQGNVPNLWIGHGTTRLTGNLQVAGPLLIEGPQASLEVREHRLEIGGSLEVQSAYGQTGRLLMSDPASHVLVHGHTRFRAAWDGEAPLRAGTLELRGHLVQSHEPSAFRAEPGHRTLFAGEGTRQTVDFEHPHAPGSGFGTLSLENPGELMVLSDLRARVLNYGEAGVGGRIFRDPAIEVSIEVMDAFIRGPMEIDELRVGGVLARGGSYPYAVELTVFTGTGIGTLLPHQELTLMPYRDVVIEAGEVRVSDAFVTVRGDLTVRGGTLRSPTGRVLTVRGDLRTEEAGVLHLADSERIVVHGNAQFGGVEQRIEGGTLWVAGDFDAEAGIFWAEPEHTVVFFGSGAQTLTGLAVFGRMAVTNSGEGLTIATGSVHGFSAGGERLLDLVGRTRVAEDLRVSIGDVVYRSTSRTHFEWGSEFYCGGVVWWEDGAILTKDGSMGGCAEANLVPGDADKKPALGDYDPPSLLTASIFSPLNGDQFEVGQTIQFLGSAELDAEVIEATLTWHSSKDGELGAGPSLSRSDLSEGSHVISLGAETVDGLISYSTIIIRVGEDEVVGPLTVTTIVVSPESVELSGDGQQRFRATAYDQNQNEMPGVLFTWTSSNLCVATVDSDGYARTAAAPGMALISASVDDVSGSGTLTVTREEGTAPNHLTGDWIVCDRRTGEYFLTAHIVHEEGESGVTGSVTMANGTTSTLNPNTSQVRESGLLELYWTIRVSGGDRTFWLDAMPKAEHLLEGQYNDRYIFHTHDVYLVRLEG
jgi:hypothetical protein